MSAFLLGIDVGTTGARALLADDRGRVLCSATREYPLVVPRPGWAEQDPEKWFEAALEAIGEVLSASGVRAGDVAGMGLTGQMHGTVFLDAKGQVVRPALLWCDQRTAKQAVELEKIIGRERLIDLTGNPALTGFSAPKILWLKQREPAAYRHVAKVLLPKDYVRYRLTGRFATEVSDASGTSLFEVRRRRWSVQVIRELGFDRKWFPPASESSEVTAKVSAKAARLTGLPSGLPVVGGAGDQAAGAVGTGAVRPGTVSVSVGTSGVVFAPTESYCVDPGGRLHSFCHAAPGLWHVMGVMLSAGGSLRWLREVLSGDGGKIPYDVLTSEAEQVPPGAEGLLFHPYLTGERTPLNDPGARGSFIGLTLKHCRGHLVRAVMEGVAFGLADGFDLIGELGVPVRRVVITGGGARSPLWHRIVSDVLGRPVSALKVDEGPALGAALLAGVGSGVFPDVQSACKAAVRPGRRTLPDAKRHALYSGLREKYRRSFSALRPIFD